MARAVGYTCDVCAKFVTATSTKENGTEVPTGFMILIVPSKQDE